MKKFGLMDLVIIFAVVAALAVGFLTYKHFRQTADKQIEKTAKIGFQVFLRGVTITSGVNPIRPGDETFISIRNVPYTNLKVVDSKIDTKKVLMPNPKGNPPFMVMDDYSQIFMYDVIVTVIDTAKITKDGAVVGGNKIKIGLPITLEGKDYKFNGTVSNVQILEDTSKPKPGIKAGETAQPKTSQEKEAQGQGPTPPPTPVAGSQTPPPPPQPGAGQQTPPPQPGTATQKPQPSDIPSKPAPPLAKPAPKGVK